MAAGVLPTFLKAAIIACLTLTCASLKCQHMGKQESFPPQEAFQHLDPSYIDNYDEIIVIGDVHGCFTELQLLLQSANLTGSNILKILAGDLMRKGPNSTEVLRFVKSDPSVIAVRGNNDQKVLSRHYQWRNLQYVLGYGDEFIQNLTQADLDFAQNLPYAISIPSLNAIVVHGGVRPGLPLESHDAFDLMNIRNLLPDTECVGGFRPLKGHDHGVAWASEWQGPQHVYFAHDHSRNLQLYPLATGVDTSCVYGNQLTGVFIKGPRTGQLAQQKALRIYFSHDPKVLEEIAMDGPIEN